MPLVTSKNEETNTVFPAQYWFITQTQKNNKQEVNAQGK